VATIGVRRYAAAAAESALRTRHLPSLPRPGERGPSVAFFRRDVLLFDWFGVISCWGRQMRRREFITLLGGAAVAWPGAAQAQPAAMPVVGFLNVESARGYAGPLAAFLKGLREAGYVEGRNVAIEYRWADGHSDRLPAMAADLAHKQVTVIAATSTPASIAAKAATTTVPIVFETASDPVRLGLVSSLSRPGGNVTGVTQTNVEVAPKRLELMHELLPAANILGLLLNPADPALADTQLNDFQAAAGILGVQLHVLNAGTDGELEKAFAELSRLKLGGLVISTDPFFTSRPEALAALAARHAMPAVSKGREFAAAGGLLSYGSDTADSYRLAGVYTGRVLKGEKPADLPVQQATKVELFINLKTAKALGITLPLALLGRADEVIE
jgi:putative tryptophan/tyrosine transport system substrate-binding protein